MTRLLSQATLPFLEPPRSSRQVTEGPTDLLSRLRARYGRAFQIRRLARGTQSIVYRVMASPHRGLAIKIPVNPEDPLVRATFLQERDWFRQAKREDRPGGRFLVQVYGTLPIYGTGSRGRQLTPALVMELANLGSLDQYLKHFGPRVSPRGICEAWSHMAQAVRALHRIGIVHRDVKPKNFFVHRSGGRIRILLGDLGIGAPNGQHMHGVEDLLSGTLTHMSENQMACAPCREADDLYALLLTFKEMLMGKTVWQVNSEVATNHILLRNIDEFGTYPVLTALPDWVTEQAHPQLLRIVNRTYENVDALIAAIERERP